MPYRRSRFCKRAFLTYTAIFSQKKQWPPLACVHPNADLDDRPAVWYNWKVRLQKIQLDGGILLSEQKTAKPLSACPVETTLTLIGDKMEGADPARPDDGDKSGSWRAEAVGRRRIAEGADGAAPAQWRNSGLLTRTGLCGSAAARGVHAHGARQSLKPILDAMQSWGEGYKASVG